MKFNKKYYQTHHNPDTHEHTLKERHAIVAHYYKKTINKRMKYFRHHHSKKERYKAKDIIPINWKRWLNKEVKKAQIAKDRADNMPDSIGSDMSEEYAKKLPNRIKSKWWNINHRYASNKNRQRTNAKNFILKKASYQDLYKIKKWSKIRHANLVMKAKRTRRINQRRKERN